MTFLSTYKESGVRRTSLAETLRKLPLSFFGKKDLADLTTTIMSDCARMETASSHWIPELIGSILSTVIIGVGLFFFNWKMTLSCFWVIPVSFLVVLCPIIGGIPFMLFITKVKKFGMIWIMSVIMGAYIFSSTTVGEFIAAMQRMHVTDKVTIPISVMFRFFPTVMEEFFP